MAIYLSNVLGGGYVSGFSGYSGVGHSGYSGVGNSGYSGTPGPTVYPGVGIPLSTGSSWGTSISTGSSGDLLVSNGVGSAAFGKVLTGAYSINESVGSSALTLNGATQTGSTLTNVQITDTSGQFSCDVSPTPLVVGQMLTISGTNSGTGSISGYSNPITYYISATNGSTSFTLLPLSGSPALTTIAGTTTGLTFSYSTASVINATQTWNNSNLSFTGIKLNIANTASAANSTLMDLQVNGSTKTQITKSGSIIITDNSGFIQIGSGQAPAQGYLSTSYAAVGSNQVFMSAPGGGAAYLAGRASMQIGWSPTSNNSLDTILTRRAAANLQLGAADAAAPIAQTLTVQGVVAGTSNTAGANFTIQGSAGTGTGAGGDIVLQVAPAGSSGSTQNTYADALRIYNNKTVAIAAGFTVATLPAAGTVGRIARVTDGDAALAWGATIINSGSGSTPYLVWDNGTNWTVFGK